ERDGVPRALPLGAAPDRGLPEAAGGGERSLRGRRGRAAAVVRWTRDLRLRPSLGLGPRGRARRRPAPPIRLLPRLRDAPHSHPRPGAGGERTGPAGGKRMSARTRTVAAGVALAVVLAVLGQRAAPRINLPGRVDPARWVLQDFRDAVYYPVVAFLDGRNPYDQSAQARTYPVGQPFPPYLPLTLLAHLPFGLLPRAEARHLFLSVVVSLTALLAAVARSCTR